MRNSSQRVRAASAQRRTQAREDLRAKILAAAVDLFVEGGYEGLSMRQLAERIGYTAPTIYLHFANKDALLFSLLDEGYSALGLRMAAAADSQPDLIGRLEALGRAYISFGLERPAYYQLMFMRRADFLQQKLAERKDHPDAFEILQRSVGQAMAAGAIQPGDQFTASLSLWSAVHGLVGVLLMAPPLDPPLVERLIDTTLAAFFNGITTQR